MHRLSYQSMLFTLISNIEQPTDLGLVSVAAEEAALDSTFKRSLCSCLLDTAPFQGFRPS